MSLSRDQQPPMPQPPVWVGNAPAYGLDPMAQGGMGMGAVPASPSSAPGRFNPLDLLKALQRHWVIALTLGLLCSGTAAALTWQFLPNATYTATALVRARNTVKSILDTKTDLERENKPFQREQEILVKSMTVIQPVLEDPEIAGLETLTKLTVDPSLWLQDEIRVDFAGDIMRISLSGYRERDLVKLVNAVTDSYLNNIGNQDRTKLEADILLLEKLEKNYEEQLTRSRDLLSTETRLLGTNNQDTLTLKEQIALKHEAALKENLALASMERTKAQIEYDLKRNQSRGTAVVTDTGPSSAEVALAVEQAISQDAQVQRYQGEIQKIKAQIERTSGTVKNPQNDPQVKKARREMEAIQNGLENYLAAARPRIQQQILNRAGGRNIQTAPDELASLAERLEFYTKYESVLKDQVEEQSSETRKTNDATSKLLMRQEEISRMQQFHDRIGTRLEQLKVDGENKVLRLELIEKSSKAKSPDSKRRLMMTGGVGAGTLVLILLGISLLEYRVRRIDSLNTVSEDLGLRLVGALPATPNRPRFALAGQMATQDAYWRSRLNESVNAIRTMMLRQSQLERLQVVMVTSATVGEGKTSLACHLATSLARAGRRTLLLDCDMRSPTAHRVFDLALEPGLSEVLRGQAALEEVSHPIALGDLRMITAGRCDLHSLHALGLEQMSEILERLRQQYDFIVVDTPPVLPVADTLLIGQHVDAALFSILREVSRVPKVYAACERLADLGVRILGAVVAGARLETHGSDYYYTAAYASDTPASASPREES